MTEKFNKQYCEELTHDQKKIVENYVFYNNKNQKKLTDFFTLKKKESIKNLEKFEDISDNKYLLSKINEVKNKIDSLDENKINDDSVVKFLTLTKMIDEIKKEF